MSDTPKVFDGCCRGLNRDDRDHVSQKVPNGGAVGGACARVGAERQTWRRRHASGAESDHNRINLTTVRAYAGRCHDDPDQTRGGVTVMRGDECAGCGRTRQTRRARTTRPTKRATRVSGTRRASQASQASQVRRDNVARAMQVAQILAKSATRRYVGGMTNPRWLRLVP
jgi:hypothetical protein